MTRRSERLQPVADLATDRQKKALNVWSEAQSGLNKAEQQLTELHQYQNEYGAMGGALTVSALLNRRQFVERVGEVIKAQAVEVTRLQRQVDRAKGTWLGARAREMAIGTVIDRYRDIERKSEERREQAEIDERMQHRRPPHARGS